MSVFNRVSKPLIDSKAIREDFNRVDCHFLEYFLPNQKMDFFKKLIYSFPEFEAMISSLDGMQVGEYAIIEAMDKAFSKDFEVFYLQQPSAVSKPLKPIAAAMKQQVDVLQTNFTTLSTLPKDLQYLKEKRKNYEKIRKEHLELVKNYNNAKANTQKAQDALDKNGNASDKSKLEGNLQKCQNIERDLEKKYNDSLEPFKQKTAENENNFVESFTAALAAAAEARQHVAEQQRNIAKEIAASINQITYYEDKKIPQLKRHLKDLDYEIVD